MFCALGLVSAVPRVSALFSCFALPDSISTVPRGSGPIFMFCAPGLIFGGTKGVGSRFHDSQARIRFQRYLGGRVPFSCFACPDSIWAVSSVSGPVFMFCAPGLIFHGVECVGPVFMFCVPGLIFDSTEVVGSRFHVLRAQTQFGRYRGRPVPFSCFAPPDLFSAVPSESGPVFMFCAPGLVFGGT
jgi:hypothetical protein